MTGCHPSKIKARNGESYCGPYRVSPEGYYVSPSMVAYDSMTPEQRARWHAISDKEYAFDTARKLKEAEL